MIGMEPTPQQYVDNMVSVFETIKPKLRDDGTVWLNLGDTYRKGKQLMLMPSRVALALQDSGWILRSEIIWHKPGPMPESVRDRPTSAHEKVFLLSKKKRYHYDQDAVRTPIPIEDQEKYVKRLARSMKGEFERSKFGGDYSILAEVRRINPALERDVETLKETVEKGANLRNVWSINTQQNKESHYALMPDKLAEPCVKAGCPQDGTVLDPFAGVGTTGLVADRLQRNSVLCEINPEYCDLMRNRLVRDAPLFAEVI